MSETKTYITARGHTVTVVNPFCGDRNEVVTPEEAEKAQALGIANGFRCPACRGLIGDADARPGRGRERLHASCWRAIQMHDVTDAERARLDGAYRAMDEAEAVIEPSEWPPVGARVRRDGEVWTVGARMGHAAVIVLGDRKRMVLATDCEPSGGQGGGLAAWPGLSPGVIPSVGGNPRPDAYNAYRNTIRCMMGDTVPRVLDAAVAKRDEFIRRIMQDEVVRWTPDPDMSGRDVLDLWAECMRVVGAVGPRQPIIARNLYNDSKQYIGTLRAYHDGGLSGIVYATVGWGARPARLLFHGTDDQARQNLADIEAGKLTADWLIEQFRGA